MLGISLSWRELPDALIERHQLSDRIVTRHEGADREIHFLHCDEPLLPVRFHERLRIMPWGNRKGSIPRLPKTDRCRQESLDAGKWQWLAPEPVDIPASFVIDSGVWYHVVEGLRGVVGGESEPRVYLLSQPSSHYYEIMTRNKRMPVFIGQQM